MSSIVILNDDYKFVRDMRIWAGRNLYGNMTMLSDTFPGKGGVLNAMLGDRGKNLGLHHVISFV